MAIQNNFPAISPSLSLDFANVGALDPRITFVRTTTATYYGTETAKAEENLLLQSQDFTTTWANTGTTDTANSTTAPDGTTTADTVTETTATSSHNVNQTFTPTSGLPYVFSVFVKKGDGVSARNFVQLGFPTAQFGANSFANFDIDSGTVTLTGAGLTSASIVSAGNNWYRCIVIDTAVASTTATAVISLITTDTAANQESYTGTTDANIFLWGCQLEQRSQATAYTPTTTQPITNYIPVLEVAAAGEARFDHNPLTFESLGLLVEEQRTNLILRSEEYDNASWTKTRASITANTIVAPDGTLTGDKLVEDTTASNSHIVTQASLSFTSGTSYTLSVYVKAAGRTEVRLLLPTAAFGANVSYNFFLNTATFAQNTAGTNDSASITSVGNGWFRCTVTAQATATSIGTIQFILLNGVSAIYTGDGFSGIFIWGAQLEVGSFSTSFIPTVAATVTRNADAASMTGTNFSSWYRADEGTVYAEASTTVSTSKISISNNTTSNRLLMDTTSINSRLLITTNGVVEATNSITYASGFLKNAYFYQTNAANIAQNGVLGLQDTSVNVPVVDRMYIGGGTTGTVTGTNYIKKIAFYPSRLTNAQLQALTT